MLKSLPSHTNLQLVSRREDMYMYLPHVLSDGQAAKAHAARKSAFLTMSPACNFEAFSLHFHLPLKVAAENFGVRATAFKKRCRAIGIRHWPYRKVRSLKRSLQELHRCKAQAPLSNKQQIQYETFKYQLNKLMAPETYGLDPSGRLGPHVQHQLLLASDDEEDQTESEEDSNDSLGSDSPTFSDPLMSDCSVNSIDGNVKMLDDVIQVDSTDRCNQKSQVMHIPSAHVSFFENGQKHVSDGTCFLRDQYYSHYNGFAVPGTAVDIATALVMKTSLTNLKKEDHPVFGLDNVDLDFLPSETSVRSFDDVDEEFAAYVSQVDCSSDRFFDDVFLQISPDYGCLV